MSNLIKKSGTVSKQDLIKISSCSWIKFKFKQHPTNRTIISIFCGLIINIEWEVNTASWHNLLEMASFEFVQNDNSMRYCQSFNVGFKAVNNHFTNSQIFYISVFLNWTQKLTTSSAWYEVCLLIFRWEEIFKILRSFSKTWSLGVFFKNNNLFWMIWR